MSESTQPKKKRWRRWLAALTVICILIGIALWLIAKNIVTEQIENQLSELGLGTPTIGSVSIGLNGVEARNITISDSKTKGDSLVTLEAMNIRHPFLRLAAGDAVFNELELGGLEAIVEVDELSGSSTFDLSSLQVPARRLKLNDAKIVLRQKDRTDLAISEIEAEIEPAENGLAIRGRVGEMLGGEWQFTGHLSPESSDWQVVLKTDALKIPDAQWQQWPLVPSSMERYLKADVAASGSITLKGDSNKLLDYLAEFDLQEAKLKLPVFDLPIKIEKAHLTASEGTITFKNVIASTNGIDRITGSGSTNISSFPITTQFKSNFEGLEVKTIRKLASDVPMSVVGTASGNANGSVEVEQTLQTALTLSAVGESANASYGSIRSQSSTTRVEIKPMIVSDQLIVETLAGSITVTAKANRQSAKDIFESLELQELSQQLEIDAKGTGDFRLDLPLETISQIATWKMQVDATVPAGSVSGQALTDVVVSANLADGNLDFSKLEAVVGQHDKSNLFATLEWPLTSNADHPDVGRFNVRGQGVPAVWIAGLIDRQVRNASGTADSEAESSQVSDSLSEFSGVATFNSKFEIPTDRPDAIEKWKVDGALENSSVITQGHELRNLSSTFALKEGSLSLSEMRGEFEKGGSLAADLNFDITQGTLKAGSLQADEVPLSWIASLGSELSPELKDNLKRLGLANDSKPNLGGNISASIDLDESVQLDDGNLSISTRITSDQLIINQRRLNNVFIDGKFAPNQIDVSKATANFEAGGKVELQGNWLTKEHSGEADLVWERVPLDYLASFGLTQGNLLKGSSSGKVKLSKIENKIDLEVLPFSIDGAVRVEQVAFAGFKFRELAVDLRTNEGILLAENFRSRDKIRGFDLGAELNLKPPFEFVANGNVDTLPLSRIFALPSVTEQIGETKNISGVASGNFKIGGRLEQFDWMTSGELAVRQPRIDNVLLSNMTAKWSHLGNDWATSTAVVKALGGSIEMTELVSQPSRVKIQLSDVNAEELSTLTKLPIQFNGALSGDASLNEWDLNETRWADLNLKGASVTVGPAEFGDLTGNAELRKGKLAYALEGRLLSGKFLSKGEANIANGSIEETGFPIAIQFTNGTLNEFYKQSNAFVSLRPLSGSVSANAKATLYLSRPPVGSGTLKINDLNWQNERLTREVSTSIKLAEGFLQLDNLRADLKRGEVSGRASIPLANNGTGSYQLDVRQFDLQRLLEVLMRDPVNGAGLLDARISGRLGRKIDGRGTLAINRAKLLGLAGRTFRLPVQFQYEPQQRSARIEFQQSRFQVFDGNVSGSATLDLGHSVDLNVDLDVSNLDTEKLFLGLANVRQSGQGDLTGHLIVKGNSIHTMRDLKGSFTGKLNRADAFKLPVLDTVAKFLGGNQLQTKDFESNDIDLRLSAGRVQIRSFNLTNSLARVAVSGSAFVDGRLDLDVAARVERLNQPTLLEQLAGSPLSKFRGSPVALFAQTANFLSERLVFVKIGGTLKRPQVRPDAGKQLQEETIRYFLRGSQILPNADGRNN